MSSPLLRFKKLQGALAGRVATGALRVEGENLIVATAETAELALALRAAAEVGLELGREVRVSLERFDGVEQVDPVSCLCEVGAHLPLAALEARLQSSGLTLGPLSPRASELRVGEWLEGAHASLRVAPGGRLEPAALCVEAALADGRAYRSHRSPRSAAGPDLDFLLLGGHGALGRITRAVLRAFPRPTTGEVRAFRVPDTAAAVRLLQRSMALEAVPVDAALWRQGDALLLWVEFEGLAFRVHRDAARLGELGKAAGLAESRDVEPPDLRRPLEAEAGWDALAATLDRAGGAVVELHRISRESVICACDRPLAGDGAVPLDATPTPPAWLAALTAAARGAR
jgi:FAD/FMN-containing dehydrogenase